MEIIQVNQENIEKEHICCAIAEKKGESCVSSKKNWMAKQFDNGLVFTKLNIRGKVFIEYIPAEYAWAPIVADNYMYINCFWVSGRYKGQGHSNHLLDSAIEDAKTKGKSGLAILSSKKKRPFLADQKYLLHKGFKVCDTAEPYFDLMYLPFEGAKELPKFMDQIKEGLSNESGIVLYYTYQCPHVIKYVDIVKNAADNAGINLKLIHIDNLEKAKDAPTPFTTYSLFINGNFITNEILTEKKFLKTIEDHKD